MVKNIKIAVATAKNGGLDDVVSDVFGRSTTFTLIAINQRQIGNVKVIKNPALSYDYGAGPIASKTLIDLGVNKVIGGELGPGASTILKKHNISTVKVKPGLTVTEAIKTAGVKIKTISQSRTHKKKSKT